MFASRSSLATRMSVAGAAGIDSSVRPLPWISEDGLTSRAPGARRSFDGCATHRLRRMPQGALLDSSQRKGDVNIYIGILGLLKPGMPWGGVQDKLLRIVEKKLPHTS